ncbi:MAG: HAMP domain-containing protein [Candidatus Riflebacteria bacterium]|nr:HAMP domain-containing protein [Candidatus Riflebacteria bacterium]
MERPFTVEARPQRLWFVVAVLALVLGGGLGVRSFSGWLDRTEAETFDECRVTLSNAVLALAERFNRPRWMRQRVEPLLRRQAGRRFDAGLARLLGRQLVRRFPDALVYAFDPKGRLVFQRHQEPVRTREMVWQGILASLRQEAGGDEAERRLDSATRICRSLFGTITSLTDLSGPDGLPQPFLNRDRGWLSWTIPQEMVTGTGSAPAGLGGFWLLVDPETLPAARVGEHTLRQMDPRLDLAAVVLATGKGGLVEARRGVGLLPRSVLRRVLANVTQVRNPHGLWMARYIPGENGRYLVAGIRSAALRGFLGRHRGLWLGMILLLLVALVALAWRAWWRGEPLGWNLKTQVVVLFVLTAVLPLVMLVVFGRERARDLGRLERNRWEERLQDTLNTVDLTYGDYLRNQDAALRGIERQLQERLPTATDPASLLEELCGERRRFEVLVLEASGRATRLNRGVASPQRDNDEFRKIVSQFLVRLLAAQGSPVPRAYSDKTPLLKDDELERLLNNFYRTRGEFNRMRVGKRQILQRAELLAAPGTGVTAVVSWIFDETEFARPFVQEVLARAAAGKYGQIDIAMVGEDGRLYPEARGRPVELLDIAHRVATFRTSEVSDITLDGRPLLAAGFSPVKLGGYQLVGLLDASLLTRERETLTLILWLMVGWSLAWMIGCALFLSRRLVGQVTGLRDFVEEISLGRYGARAAVTSRDELGQLAGTFNAMAEKLEHGQRLRRFVSEKVVDEVKKDDRISLALTGSRLEVAVLFSHLHHFDALLEAVPPDRLIGLLNAYFSRLDPVIRAHGGVIDKLIGDAIMAVFEPVAGADHPALRAARAAAGLLAEQEALNRERASTGGAPLRTDVGVHFGAVISGKVGSREGRIDYTVIGDTVNTAARLSSAAAARPRPAVLVSGSVAAHLGADLALAPLEPMALKGKRAVVEVFELVLSYSPCPGGSVEKK